MSKELDRTQVLKNIKVRTSKKNDCSWIKPREKQADSKEKSAAASGKKSSYILSAVKKFESEDSTSLPSQKKSLIPNRGSAKQANGDGSAAQKDAPSKESKVDAVCDLKFQSSTEQLIQNCKAQADKFIEENKEIEASPPIHKSKVESKKKADEVAADKEEQIQPTPVRKQNLEAAAPVKPAEIKPANKSVAEDQKEHVAKVSSDKDEQIQPTTVRKQNLEAAAPVQPAETTPAHKSVVKDQEEHATEIPVNNKEQIQPATVKKQNLEAAAPVKPAETTPANKSAAEDQKEHAAKVPADKKEQIQPATVEKQNIEAAAPVKLAETTPATRTVEDQEEHAAEIPVNNEEEVLPIGNQKPATAAPVKPAEIKPAQQTAAEDQGEHAAKVPADNEEQIQPATVEKQILEAAAPVKPAEIKPAQQTAAEDQGERVAKVPADNEEQIQPTPVRKQNLEAAAPVKPAEITPAQKTAADQKEHAEAPSDNKEQIQTTTVKKQNLEAAAPVKPAEIKPAQQTAAEDQGERVAKVPADNEEQIQPATVEKQNLEAAAPVKPAEKRSAQTSSAENKEEHADTPPEPSNRDNSEAPAGTQVENCVPEGRTSGRSVTAEVLAAPGVQPKPREESVIQTDPANTACLEDTNQEVSVQTVDGQGEQCPPQETNDHATVMDVKFTAESSPKTADNTGAADEEASLPARVGSGLLVESLSDSPAQPTDESPTESSCSPGQDEETIGEALVQAEVLEIPVDVGAAQREEAPPSDDEQPVPKAQSESPKSAERESEPAGLTEPVLETRTEEVVKSAPQQSVQHKSDQMMEPSPKDAAPAADVLGNSAFRAISLTDALDVDSQSDKSVLKPEDSEQTIPEQVKQERDNANISEKSRKPEGKGHSTHAQIKYSYKATCSYCDRTIDGNTKIIVSEPPVTCHPECFKCGVCSKALGDLLTPIFLHDNVIHCRDCFQNAVNA